MKLYRCDNKLQTQNHNAFCDQMINSCDQTKAEPEGPALLHSIVLPSDLLGEKIADFGQQHFLARCFLRFGRLFLFLPLQTVHHLDHDEQDP